MQPYDNSNLAVPFDVDEYGEIHMHQDRDAIRDALAMQTAPDDGLSFDERSDYLRCKFRIKNGVEDVIKAAEEVRNRRLYREEYKTFEDFCQEIFGKSRRRINQLITANNVNEELGTNGSQPVNERVARELAKLPSPELRSAVLAAAIVTSGTKEPSAEHIRSTVTVVAGIVATGGYVDVGDGTNTPLAAAITNETYERKQRQDEHIKNRALFTSNSAEWFTPPHIIKAVHQVFDVIELDPASCESANAVVGAKRFYSEADNGLDQSWQARTVFMNPPYGRAIDRWAEKLAAVYEQAEIGAAITLLPARTDTAWIRKLAPYPRCFLWGRLTFGDAENSATFPSVVVYLGNEVKRFASAFEALGDIYVQWKG